MYASGITFTGVTSASPSPATLLGADNGLSLSLLDPSVVVLGQDVGQAGNPGILLNNREIPMGGFDFSYTGGGTVNVVNTVTGAAATTSLRVAPTWNTSGNATGILVDCTNTASGLTAFLIKANVGGNNAFVLDALGDFGFADPLSGGTGYVQGTVFNNGNPITTLNNAILRVSCDIQPASGNGQVAEFSANSFYDQVTGTVECIGFHARPNIIQQGGTGVSRGFYFQPTISSLLGKLIAFENTSGDVYLNSTAGTNIGRTGIHGVTTPTAWLHLGAGTIQPNSAPLKFSSGPVMTTAQVGAMEYNGIVLSFTRQGTTRETVFTGLSGAAAPATSVGVAITNFYGTSATNFLGDPVSWASVVIGITTFKIPLYT